MKALKGIAWAAVALLVGALAGWFANRIMHTVAANPITVEGADWADSFLTSVASRPLWLAPEYMSMFWAIGAVVFVGLLMFASDSREKEKNRRVRGQEFGSARWAEKAEIEKFRASSFEDNFILSENAFLSIPRIPQPTWIKRMVSGPGPQDRNKHIMVIGGSGSGKGYNVIGPNILQAKYSFMVTDPKGDILTKYGSYLIDRGYKIKVVNVKDPQSFRMSLHYNPLVYITSQASIMSLVDIIISNTESDQKNSGDDFFIKAERSLYMCLIAYLYYAFAGMPEEQTIPKMLDLLALAEASEQNEDAVSALDVLLMETYREELIDKYGSEESAMNGEEWFVITQYEGFKKAAGETAKSILISCFVRLAPFAIGSLREMFSSDELELGRVGEEKTAFFLIMSDTSKTFNFILAMLLYQFFDINTAIADANPDSHCSIPIMCLLDEVANIGKIPDLDIKIATLRSRWINLCLFIQNVAQLEKGYTKEGARVIQGNCDTLLFLGRSDQDTNEMISKRLGKETIEYKTYNDSRKGGRTTNVNYQAHDLMSPEDLGSNPEKFADDECIVLINNFHPFKDRKFQPPTHCNAAEHAKTDRFDAGEYVTAYRAERFRAKQREDRKARELFVESVMAYNRIFEGVKACIAF